MLESRAGRYNWDVVSQTTPQFIFDLKQKGLIAPYNSPERRHFSSDVKDAEGFWTGTFAQPTGLGVNMRQVKKEDVPKNYEDLLSPQWKGGKISVDNESSELLVGLSEAWGQKKAVEYLKALAAQSPVIGRGHSQRVQLLAAGEFPLALAYTPNIEWARSQGAAVDWVHLEPVVIKVDGIMLGAKAAHPNAAKLFIDFVLSQRGQELFQSFNRVSLRKGVEPNPRRLIEGYRRVVLDPGKGEGLARAFKASSRNLWFSLTPLHIGDRNMLYIDCDSHILPVDAFDDVDEEFWSQKPRLVSDHQGYSFIAYEARQRNIPDYARPIPSPFTPRLMDLKKNDPAVRVKDLAASKFDMQVLVPRNGPFYYDVEPRLAASVCRSYNNATGRIVRQYPNRFIGLATLPLQDVGLATKELERSISELGLHAAVVYTSIGEKTLDSAELWPFYSKAHELNIPLIVHPVNTGPMVGGWRLGRHYATKGFGLWSALGNPMEASLTFAELLFGGVLDAFPGLRVCLMEAGGTQVPHLMDSLDAVYQGEGDYERFKEKPKRRPVEYLDRVYFGVRPTETLLGVLMEKYGTESWVIGSDYPHGDTMGSWPNTISVINAREDLSMQAKEALLGRNAVRLFALNDH